MNKFAGPNFRQTLSQQSGRVSYRSIAWRHLSIKSTPRGRSDGFDPSKLPPLSRGKGLDLLWPASALGPCCITHPRFDLFQTVLAPGPEMLARRIVLGPNGGPNYCLRGGPSGGPNCGPNCGPTYFVASSHGQIFRSSCGSAGRTFSVHDFVRISVLN